MWLVRAMMNVAGEGYDRCLWLVRVMTSVCGC